MRKKIILLNKILLFVALIIIKWIVLECQLSETPCAGRGQISVRDTYCIVECFLFCTTHCWIIWTELVGNNYPRKDHKVYQSTISLFCWQIQRSLLLLTKSNVTVSTKVLNILSRLYHDFWYCEKLQTNAINVVTIVVAIRFQKLPNLLYLTTAIAISDLYLKRWSVIAKPAICVVLYTKGKDLDHTKSNTEATVCFFQCLFWPRPL